MKFRNPRFLVSSLRKKYEFHTIKWQTLSQSFLIVFFSWNFKFFWYFGFPVFCSKYLNLKSRNVRLDKWHKSFAESFGLQGSGDYDGIREVFVCSIWNPQKSCKHSQKSWALESIIQLKNSGIQIPLTKNPESSTWNSEFTAWNPCSKTVLNRSFYRYGGHNELIRFKEYYRMPRGHEHISFAFSSTFRDIFS